MITTEIMASSCALIDDESLLYPLCLDKYKEPYYLPCTHSCLEAYQKHKAVGRIGTGINIVCFPFSYTDMEKPHGFSTSCIEKIFPKKENTEQIFQEHKNESKKKIICFPCQHESNEATEATSWCFDCDFAICDPCKNFHDIFPRMIGHKVSSLASVLEDKMSSMETSTDFCLEHKHEKLAFYCCTHQKTCCEICSVTEHRNCLSLISLDCAVDQLADLASIRSLKNLLEKSNERMILLKENRKHYIVDLQVCKVDIENRMTNLREEVDRYLDRIQREFITYLNKLHTSTVSSLENEISKLDTEQAKITGILSSLDKSVKRRSKLLKMTDVKNGRGLERHMNEFIIKMEKQMRRMSYNVILQKINTIKSNLPSFGSVKVESDFIQNISRMDLSKKYLLERKSSMVETSNEITGITFLPSGEIVCCLYQDKRLCRYNVDGNLIKTYIVDHNPFDVALFSEKEVIVSYPSVKCLQILNIGNMDPTQQIHVSDQCYGVCCRHEKIYISHSYGINVFDSRGFEEQKYAFDNGPEKYINIKNSGEILFTSKNGLYSISTEGEHQIVYNQTVPLFGVTSDYDGQIYVASNESAIMLSDKGRVKQSFHLKYSCRAIAFQPNQIKVVVTSRTDIQCSRDAYHSKSAKRLQHRRKKTNDEMKVEQKHHFTIYQLTGKGT